MAQPSSSATAMAAANHQLADSTRPIGSGSRGSHHSFPPKLGFLGLVLTKRMKKEVRKGKPKGKGKGKGKGKPKSKHTRARANPIASSPDRALGISLPVDLTSSVSSTTPGNASPSPLPDHKSSPSRENSSEDNDESSPCDSSQDHGDYSFGCYSEDYDDFASVLSQPSTSTTRSKPISAALVNEHNTPPPHRTYLDAARKGKQPAQKQALQPKEIMPPQDPRASYARVMMADQRPSHSPHAAKVTGVCVVLVPQQVLPPSVESLEILDYSFEEQGSFSLAKLHAARLIPGDADFEKEEVPKIKEICEPHVGYLKSIQNLHGLLKEHRLMRCVKIFRGKMTILLATAQGRLLAQAMVAVIWECHSQKRSWNGTFDIEHIRIIEPCNSNVFMMIVKDPVQLQGMELLQAKANDLHKAAAILQSLYRAGDDLPVYFEEFIQNLQQPTRELVVNERAFMEYLSYHPAIIPSTSRSTFVCKMSNISTEAVMLSKPPAYLYDWRTIVEAEIHGKIKAKDINYHKEKKYTDVISVLYTVFHYSNNYDDKMGGLIRFMRNVIEHGMEHDGRVIHIYELELYLAQMVRGFPCTIRTLLMSGTMELFCGYKVTTPSNFHH